MRACRTSKGHGDRSDDRLLACAVKQSHFVCTPTAELHFAVCAFLDQLHLVKRLLASAAPQLTPSTHPLRRAEQRHR